MSAFVRIVARLATEIALLGPVAIALLSATASAAFSASCMEVSVASARSLCELSSSIRGVANAKRTVRSLMANLIAFMTFNNRKMVSGFYSTFLFLSVLPRYKLGGQRVPRLVRENLQGLRVLFIDRISNKSVE